MKPNPIPVIAMVLLYCLHSAAQPVIVDSRYRVSLRSGSFIPEKNITAEKVIAFSNRAARAAGRGFALLQFEKIPGVEQRNQLRQNGIELLEYLPSNAYTISYTGTLNSELLQQVNARAVVELSGEQKMQPELAKGNFPAWAVKITGTVDLWISYPKTFTHDLVINELRGKNFDILPTLYSNYRIIGVRISALRTKELAELPFVEYVQFAPHPDVELNYNSRVNARANVLHSALPGGRNLRGEGVVIGIGDNANPLQHIDISDRIIQRYPTPGGAHGLHVIGTAAGAGIIVERVSGYAPRANVVAQQYSNILAYASPYALDHGMVISNNSYGNILSDCKNFGYYELYSRILDKQANDLPNLSIVFAGGNSGLMNCGEYASGYGTVLSGYQAAKNIITVGATTEHDSVASFSSKGPVQDGRIKPEISAQGKRVLSCWSSPSYSFNNGTSMAAPAVSGGLALLYQRYKQLNAGANPKNGLMKAILCNGATDLGNPGPDYTFGFGWMNLLRSVQMLENNAWFNTTVALSGTNTHNIIIPATPAIAQLKVMLYWNDSAASVLSAQTLVNDLDLEVEFPPLTITFPQKLDTIPANINNPATTGADHINNIEQILIDNPVPGATYVVKVKGTTIPSAIAQDYFVTYDLVPVSTTLTYPVGSERFQPGDSVYISWDSWGAPANSFTVEFFDGVSWSTIPNGTVAANLRQVKWFVPNVLTDAARIRVTRNSTAMVSTSEVFTILGTPHVTVAANQCEGYFTVDWTSVAGATDYEIMMLRGGEMVPVGTSAGNSFSIGGLSPDTLYYVSVRARLNGNPGQRDTTVARMAVLAGVCPTSVSDNDIRMESFVTPLVSGRKFTSTEFLAPVPLTVRIKNLDDVVSSSALTFSYTINGGAAVTDPPVSPSINPGATFDYTFAAPVDLTSLGSFAIEVTVTKATDPITTNNIVSRTIRHLDNLPISLATTWLDDLETVSAQEHTSRIVGLTGGDRYDFINSTIAGRIRSFVNTGIAYSGSKALTLDANSFVSGGNIDSLTGTFNLSSFNTATDDIRFDFRYKNHGQVSNAANNVWIRGDDQKTWIKVFDLFANQPEADGSYKLISAVELSDSLTANTQNYSSSFQVRWGQWGRFLAADNDGAAGYSFDNIRLYRVTDDLKMISIDTPIVSSCGLSAATPVRITVRNTSNSVTANPVPVQFRVDGGGWVMENIPAIAANTTVTYTFTGTANLLATGSHLVEARVVYPTDSYFDNDTMSVQLINSPVITVTTSTPYLQDFETNNGSWYSGGKNVSWEYGTPASTKINRAASGAKAWKTQSKGNYNDKERSYLYSPCFDITGLVNPTLSLSISLDLEDCGSSVLCDGAWIEYSADGITWDTLGAFGQGTNWYNKNFSSGAELWSVEDYTRWHVATVPLPQNISKLRLRVVMFADPLVSKEGVGIDDIHIYDNTYGIYTVTGTSPVVNQAVVNGTSWIDFVESGTQKLIASIKPDGQDLGSTNAQSFVHTGAVRFNAATSQYYHNRNITIKPTSVNLPDSATVRFYFTDAETEALINVTGCGTCFKPSTAYDLGVTKYSDPDDNFENGTLNDNNQGNYLFINSLKARKVPFDRGYYAEFRVKDFSEFWLNNGGFDNNTPLPIELISFTAKRRDKEVVTDWVTASEQNLARFEIEVARGITLYQQNSFEKIGEVRATGNSNQHQQYQFVDTEPNKSGVRYYRLKIIEVNGSYSYSIIRPVWFNDEVKWQVYPNPSPGNFNLVYQLPEGEELSVKVYDATGRAVEEFKSVSNGFLQKISVDIQKQRFAPGLYLLEARAGERKQVFRLVKQ